MNTIDESLFESIKDSMNNNNTGSQFNDILRFEKDKTYTVRLLPYMENPKQSVYPYRYHGWKSASTGNYVEYLDSSMYGEPNPIAKYSYDEGVRLNINKLDDKNPAKIKARQLWKKKAWLFNCYVIEDPTNPDNEGQVKIIKMGKQLYDIYESHFSGERKSEFGMKIWSPNSSGCDLKIVVKKNEGDYPSYVTSYFTSPKEIPGIGDDQDKIKEILADCKDLYTVFPQKTYEEMKEAIELHYLGNVEENSSQTNNNEQREEQSSTNKSSTPQPEVKVEQTTSSKEPDLSDLDSLLEGM